MWYHRFFKPTLKVGQAPPVPAPVLAQTQTQRLLAFVTQVDVDTLVHNPVLGRFLLTLHHSDITQLFDAVMQHKRTTPSLVAVNLRSYFKTAGTPPSVCLQRLCETLGQHATPSYTVSQDIEQLTQQLQEAHRIATQPLKDTP